MSDDWRHCSQCGGIRIPGGDSCLAHANPVTRAALIKQFSESGDLDVRGVTISDALLEEIFAAAPHNADGHPTFSAIQFGGATFEADAWFTGATFEGQATFTKATFRGTAGFSSATFEDAAWFGGATFEGPTFFGATFEDAAWFIGATFKGKAKFADATFKDAAEFNWATFEDNAVFGGATFKRVTQFHGATFVGEALFGGATFKGNADFSETTFEDRAVFGGARFADVARFNNVTFKQTREFGPIYVEGLLFLDEAQFDRSTRIEIDARVLTCRQGRFPSGVRLNVRRAVIRLDDSELPAPSLLTGPGPGSAETTEQPKLLSLQGANVAGLALGSVSLADCRFAGAHNLDRLRLEADTVFGFSPAAAGWERRQVIAEEKAWRSTRSSRWKPPPWPSEGQPKPLSPGAIAGLYRALRKGREDAKDEPDAADFYYGEMEMRRHDYQGTGDANRWRGRATRFVLTAYWLVSGYGLRAWRSLVALTVVTALFAIAFHLVGFIRPPEPASYWTSLLYAFRSTVSLTDSQVTLTAWGSFFQALLRITGPVLLGLTLLALRNRVKR